MRSLTTIVAILLALAACGDVPDDLFTDAPAAVQVPTAPGCSEPDAGTGTGGHADVSTWTNANTTTDPSSGTGGTGGAGDAGPDMTGIPYGCEPPMPTFAATVCDWLDDPTHDYVGALCPKDPYDPIHTAPPTGCTATGATPTQILVCCPIVHPAQ